MLVWVQVEVGASGTVSDVGDPTLMGPTGSVQL